MLTFTEYLALAAVLFCIGLAGVLTRRNAIIVLAGVEMMLNAANINLAACSRFLTLPSLPGQGQVFALFAIAIAGAEAAVGLALVIAVYRHFRSVNVDEVTGLKG